MSGHRVFGRVAPLAIAAAVSLIFANATVATTWDPPITLESALGDLAGLGGSSAVAVCGGVDVCRTSDGGLTWSPAVHVGNGYSAAISGVGQHVDVAWISSSSGTVRYARSTDGGASFRSPQTLGGISDWVDDNSVSVARGPDGLVAVSWAEVDAAKVYIRVSADGGRTFGSRKTIDSINRFLETMPTEVAVGSGVIYVAYSAGWYRLLLKKSVDLGATWSAPFIVSRKANAKRDFDLAAEQSSALVAWASDDSTRYRWSIDAGGTWTRARYLWAEAPNPKWNRRPDVDLTNGVLRAVFPDAQENVLYRASYDGLAWTDSENLGPGYGLGAPYAEQGAYVAFADAVLVINGADVHRGLPWRMVYKRGSLPAMGLSSAVALMTA